MANLTVEQLKSIIGPDASPVVLQALSQGDISPPGPITGAQPFNTPIAAGEGSSEIDILTKLTEMFPGPDLPPAPTASTLNFDIPTSFGLGLDAKDVQAAVTDARRENTALNAQNSINARLQANMAVIAAEPNKFIRDQSASFLQKQATADATAARDEAKAIRDIDLLERFAASGRGKGGQPLRETPATITSRKAAESAKEALRDTALDSEGAKLVERVTARLENTGVDPATVLTEKGGVIGAAAAIVDELEKSGANLTETEFINIAVERVLAQITVPTLGVTPIPAVDQEGTGVRGHVSPPGTAGSLSNRLSTGAARQ